VYLISGAHDAECFVHCAGDVKAENCSKDKCISRMQCPCKDSDVGKP